jgi:hypothetical protein
MCQDLCAPTSCWQRCCCCCCCNTLVAEAAHPLCLTRLRRGSMLTYSSILEPSPATHVSISRCGVRQSSAVNTLLLE